MWNLASAAVTVLLLGMAEPCALAKDCPTKGDTQNARIGIANEYKNRDGDLAPVDTSITLASILAPGNDTTRFSNDKGATITGYIAVVKPGGSESANCHATDPTHIDTHIALVSSPSDFGRKSRYVIVEVTPHTRGLTGTDFSTLKSWMHRKVKVTGWLFFDAEHQNAAENTHPGGKNNWRASCWEIHPIVSVALEPP